MFNNIILDLTILALFAGSIYIFQILPRQREFRKRQKLVQTIEAGTHVLTFGGLLGVVRQVDRETGIVTLEVAEGLEVRLIAAAITGEFDAEAYASSAQKVMTKD